MGTYYICMHSYVCIIFIFVQSPSIDARTACMDPHQSTTRYRRLSRTQRRATTMIYRITPTIITTYMYNLLRWTNVDVCRSPCGKPALQHKALRCQSLTTASARDRRWLPARLHRQCHHDQARSYHRIHFRHQPWLQIAIGSRYHEYVVGLMVFSFDECLSRDHCCTLGSDTPLANVI